MPNTTSDLLTWRRASAALLPVLLALVPSALGAQDLDSARTAFVRSLVSTATRGDSAALDSLLRARGDAGSLGRLPASHLVLSRLAAQGGDLVVIKVESHPNNTMLTVRAAGVSRHALLNIGWHREQRDRLRYVELLKAWDPRVDSLDWSPARDARELVERLDANINALVQMGAYSGTVLVAHRDSVLLARGYGWANLDDSVRNSVRTRFHTASMGKMFTAVGIAQLADQGLLRLDDTLAAVLPDYPNAERARQVTIRQLLSHTAGLGDIWSHPEYRRSGPHRTNRDLAWAIASGPTMFVPGTRWAYSNEGYTVLGAIIERLGGMPFEAYLRRRVWEPAQMTGMMAVGGDRIVPWRAIGYEAAEHDVLSLEALRPTWHRLGATSGAHGAGGYYGTVTDFFRFARTLQRGGLVNPATRDSMWVGRNALPWDASTSYGFGFMRSTIAGHDFVSHGGGGGYGIDNMVYFSPDGTWTIVVLGNYNPPAAADLASAIARFVAASGGRVASASSREVETR